MRRYIIIIALLMGITIEAGAVLKEKNLEETLTILRSELTKHYHEMTSQREEREERIKEVLTDVGMQDFEDRMPHELSGGELQRFCIARALNPQTRILICDEITTMLDVVTQAQIWEVIMDLAEERGMGVLVITHNAYLAERLCDLH